jgi:uncharacterized protein (TIGR03437 family)
MMLRIRVVGLIFALSLFCLVPHAQVITTVAGTTWALPASGISALKAPLGVATGVAIDALGNIYIADSFDNVVARVSPDGILTIIAGNGNAGFSGDGGPAAKASLNAPGAVAIDYAGNVYIADSANNRIRKVSGGIITTVAGDGTAAFSGDGGSAGVARLNVPTGVALDTSGNLYVADFGNNRIRMISGGTITTVAGTGSYSFSGDGGPAVLATFQRPEGVALDSAGNLYVADVYNNRIRKVSNGNITTVAGNGTAAWSGDGGPATSASLQNPRALTVAGNGDLYIADSANFVVRKVSGETITTVAGNGYGGFLGDGGPATLATLSYPSGVASDSAGNLYIADYYRGRIRKVSGGTISTVAGNGQDGFAGDGGPGFSAALNYPSRVVADTSGNIYIADQLNNRVRKLSSGTITTVAGSGTEGFSGDASPATSASLNYPWGVAVDSSGNLYIADDFNNRIRKVSAGKITTVAGNGNYGFSGDGGPATSSSLSNPQDVAVDSSGNLYIADLWNQRIRKVTPNGLITTVAGNGTAGFSGDGGPATSASLNHPASVAIDVAGNLFISDNNNHRVRKVTPDGLITTIAGNGSSGFSGDQGLAINATLNFPVGLAIDSAGRLYIADSSNDRVRMVAGGIITTVAGNGGFGGFSGDGGLATSASLHFPSGVAVDSAGNLYIADSGNNRVRVVLSSGPSYQAAPAALSFSAKAGSGSAPSAQVITLSTSVPGLAFTTSVNVPWLNVTPSSGAIPATLQANVDPSSLAAGTYNGTITITVPYGASKTTTISVTFTVQPSIPPALAVDTKNISFSAIEGSGALNQQLQVSNAGGGSLSFTATTATTSGGSWLSISATNGAATPSSPVSLTVTATPGSLTAGTYSGTITITGAGSTVNVAVTLSISAATRIILISQNALSFTAVAQGGVPLPQTFGILNTGQASLSWTATATTISGGNWLQISPSNGTVQRPYLDVSLVTVSIDPSALGAGTYYGKIQIAAPAANTPQVMTVILTVLPAGLTLGPQVFPSGLIFTGVAGVTPGSQDVMVGNPTGQVNSFQSGLIGTGFSFLPTNASVQPNQPTTVRVYPDFSNLAPASIQQGTIALQFSDRSPSQTINVLMVVAPSGVTPNSVGAEFQEQAEPRAASGCAAQAWSVQFRSLQPNFAAVLGQPTAVDVQVADGCGSLVGPGGQSAYVAASVTGGDPVIAMTHIGNGIWQGTWKPVNATGAVTLFVTALGPNGVGGQNRLSGAVSAPAPAATTPTVTAQGVVHAASDQGGVPIAPGGLITVYGVNLSDGVGQNTGLPLPQQLNGTQVLLGDQPLPILYTSTGQLNVQVPYAVPVNTQYQLTVQHGNTLSVPQQLVVAAGLPGIFTVNQQGTGQGAIMKSDGVTLAQPSTPASIGETVVIYCTGLGAVSPAVKEGAPAPSTPPLSTTVNTVTVTIGGNAAHVAFSGLTPGYAGLYQVNAVVPAGIATGDAVPVVVSVVGQTSPAVTIAVR